MTTKLSTNGHIFIPKAVREEKCLSPGDGFDILTTIRGEIILRPLRRPKSSLREHMRRMRHLALKRQDEPLTPPPAL